MTTVKCFLDIFILNFAKHLHSINSKQKLISVSPAKVFCIFFILFFFILFRIF